MNDCITIHNLELWTHIGVPNQERKQEQRVLVTIHLFVDTTSAAQDDDVTQSIDYEQVALDMQELAKTERKTIERFVEDTAALVLEKYKPVRTEVTLKKFILPNVEEVSLTITRP